MEAEDCENPTSVIVLPSRVGNQLIDSDAEDVPEGLNDECEHIRELEVEFQDSDQPLLDSTSKTRRMCFQPKSIKKDLDVVLSSVLLNKICDKHPELIFCRVSHC